MGFNIKNKSLNKTFWFFGFITCLFLCLFIILGCWQLERAAQKNLLQKQYQERSAAEFININHVQHLTGDLRFYRARVTGYFDNQHQFLLDNKFSQHQLGYQVLTPFILTDSNYSILINRGWISQGSRRAELPMIPPVLGRVTLQGIIAYPDNKSFVLENTVEDKFWPQRIAKIDTVKMGVAARHVLLPFYILLDPVAPHGFTRDWRLFNSKITTHYGYAFQWFALAVTLLIIFIVVNIRRKIHDVI